jgi:hypothetical protein
MQTVQEIVMEIKKSGSPQEALTASMGGINKLLAWLGEYLKTIKHWDKGNNKCLLFYLYLHETQ